MPLFRRNRNVRVNRNTIKCPYCLNEVNKSEFRYVCDECGTEQPSYISVRRCSKSNCGGRLYLKCPKCENNRIPASFFDYRKYINFCVVGPTNCGKTNYITVMLDEFNKKLGGKYLLSHMNDTTKRIQDENRTILYDNKIVVPNTQRGSLIPQLWKITDIREDKDLLPVYNMTVFDGAGEDYTDMNTTVRNYIGGSEYLFFLIDPTQLNSIVGANGTVDYGFNLIEDMSDYIRNVMGLPEGMKIDKKVAVILTKFDEVDSFFAGTQVAQENGFINSTSSILSDLEQINREISTWLQGMGEVQLISALKKNFKYTRFFGVSSYGHAPDLSGNVGTIVPHRVLDPLLWVLQEEGIFI